MRPARNAVLVIIDGLRADHLPIYGYPRDTAPRLRDLARSGVVFEQAICQANWTLPSVASILTSRRVDSHGALHLTRRLPRGMLTLPGELRRRGLRTGFFAGGNFMKPEYGLSDGFDCAETPATLAFRDTMPLALDWLSERKDEPFFLLVHGNDLHPGTHIPHRELHAFDAANPVADRLQMDYYWVKAFNGYSWHELWGPPPGGEYMAAVEAMRADPDAMRHVVAHYDARITHADFWVGRLWDELEKSGRLKDTAVIVTSDHGLELGERGLVTCGYHASLPESILRVPLILWLPGRPPARIRSLVELIDAAPTLLEALGLPPPACFEGSSLLPLLDRRLALKRYAFSRAPLLYPEETPLSSIRSLEWKLVLDHRNGSARLHRVTGDGPEDEDWSQREPAVAEELMRELTKTLKLSVPALQG